MLSLWNKTNTNKEQIPLIGNVFASSAAFQNKGAKWKMNVYKSNFTLPNFPSSSNNLHLNMPNIYSWGTSRRDVKEWKFCVVKLSFLDLSVDICNVNLENTQIANVRHIEKIKVYGKILQYILFINIFAKRLIKMKSLFRDTLQNMMYFVFISIVSFPSRSNQCVAHRHDSAELKFQRARQLLDSNVDSITTPLLYWQNVLHILYVIISYNLWLYNIHM